MAEEKDPTFSFGTFEGEFVNGDKHEDNSTGKVDTGGGDYVIGALAKGDATLDASGQVVNYRDIPETELTSFFDEVRKQCNDPLAEDEAFPDVPDSIFATADEYAQPLPEPTPEHIEQAESLDANQLFSSYELELSKSPEEQDASWLSAVIKSTEKYAPRIGMACLAAGQKGMEVFAKDNWGLAAGIAFIGTLRGKEV